MVQKEQRTKDAIYRSYRRTIIVSRFLPHLIILGPLRWSPTVESRPFRLILCSCFMPARVSWRICTCAPCISQNRLGIKRNDIDHRAHLSLSQRLGHTAEAEALDRAGEDLFVSTLSDGHINSLSTPMPPLDTSTITARSKAEVQTRKSTLTSSPPLPLSTTTRRPPSMTNKHATRDAAILNNTEVLITQCAETLKQPASHIILDEVQLVIHKCYVAVNGICTSASLERKRKVTDLLNNLAARRHELLNLLPKDQPITFSSGTVSFGPLHHCIR